MYQARGKQWQAQAQQNLWKDFGLESLSKNEVFQIIKCSEGADEEDRAEETSQDGEPLGGAQLLTEHLHPGKHQHWQQTGQHQRGACVHRHDALINQSSSGETEVNLV